MYRARTLLTRMPRTVPPVVRILPRQSRALSTSLRRANEQIPRPGTGPKAEGSIAAEHWNHPSVTYDQVKKWTQQPSEDVVLVDVREPDEIAQGSIPSSVALPLSQLPSALTLPAHEFEQKFGFPKPGNTEEKKVVFYCRSGKRSLTACDLAVRSGWKGVMNYDGSWLDWTAKEQERGKDN